MALADSVPGVSGGTVAFILGFYDKFIDSLNTLVSKGGDKKDAIKFLLKLGIGWAIGMCLATLILSSIFDKHIYVISSVFLGFILFAIPVIIRDEKKILKGKFINLVFTFIGILVVVLLSYFNPSGTSSLDISLSGLSFGLCLYTFLAGMIAISAMVLPGISGSTILLIFGLYMPIINGIKETLHFNFEYLPILFIFGIGVIMGIVLVIRLVKKALLKYRSQTIYTVIGLMIGSLYAIVMGPVSLDKSALSFNTFSILGFLLGGVIIFLLEFIKVKIDAYKE
ncbi:MAG: DUF368 domain-containing protein [bacterium]|nr:DUF368 domain-containing protein [bacterium]